MKKQGYIAPSTIVITVAPQLMQAASGGEEVYNSTVTGSSQMGRRGSWSDWDDESDWGDQDSSLD